MHTHAHTHAHAHTLSHTHTHTQTHTHIRTLSPTLAHARSARGDRDAVGAARQRVREAVLRPRVVVPVTDWVTCVAQDRGSGVVLAGALGAQLLVLGPG